MMKFRLILMEFLVLGGVSTNLYHRKHDRNVLVEADLWCWILCFRIWKYGMLMIQFSSIFDI